MDSQKKIILKYSFAGAMTGYFIFHPLVMLLSHLMAAKSSAFPMAGGTGALSIVLQSFSVRMLPWSLSFALFNCVIGLYYGSIKAEKLAREKLIASLQKALADVQTLSGMLPICAWCIKVRNDQGYWQKIEAYFKSRSDLDFTHAICDDCARKQFPEHYNDAKENTGEKG